jgi:hypothetical protein
VIDASAVSPLSVEAGQLFRLTATGHGQPSLAFTWGVASASAPSTSQPGANTWWDTSGFAPGVYVITLQLTNPITTVASLPVAVTVRPEQGADFYTVIPCRVADTRMGMGGSSMAAGTARTLAITGPACGIPDGAKAVSVNVTAANPTGQGELAVYPGNYPAPGTTVVAFAAGQNRATAAILPLASDGTGTLAAAAAMTGTGSVDVIVDVNGYFL